MSETIELLLRVVVSLGCVLGVIWLAARGWQRTPGGRISAASSVSMVGRQSLGQRSSVALVKVGEDRVLVLGVSEHRVELLTEMTAEEVAPPEPELREEIDLGSAVPAISRRSGMPALQRQMATGHALSPATWRQAVDVVRDRTSRR